jgi:hypothetical protein
VVVDFWGVGDRLLVEEVDAGEDGGVDEGDGFRNAIYTRQSDPVRTIIVVAVFRQTNDIFTAPVTSTLPP